jgi:uncharacterized SAM-binding protein YcdF (DUF218 family)
MFLSSLVSIEFFLIFLILLLIVTKNRNLKFMFFVFLIILFLLSPVSSMLIQQQEMRFEVLQEVPEDISLILVLGSGGVPVKGLSVYQRLDNAALQRTLEGIRLWKLKPEKFLVFSSRGKEGYASQASLYAEVALEQGVNPTQIRLIEKGVTTETEALDFIGEFPEVKKIVLVTSAIHLRRASGIFGGVGVEVIPAPADFQVKIHPGGNRINWLPSLSSLIKWNTLLHEGIGLLWVELRIRLGKFPVSGR